MSSISDAIMNGIAQSFDPNAMLTRQLMQTHVNGQTLEQVNQKADLIKRIAQERTRAASTPGSCHAAHVQPARQVSNRQE